MTMTLRRIPNSKYSEIQKCWTGTAVIIGGGPSLTFGDVHRVRLARESNEIKVVAVNDSFLWAPWADVHYAADSHWHKWMQDGIDKPGIGLTAEKVKSLWDAFPGERCSIENSGANITDERVHILRNRDYPNHGNGLSLDPQALVTGRNSGFQALNLAVLAGARRVILLGFDGAPAHDGKTHWSGGHPRPTPQAAYPEYIKAMSMAERELDKVGVSVINCSPGTRIDSFPKMSINTALA